MNVDDSMLNALLSEGPTETPVVPYDEMTAYLKRHVNNVGVDVRRSLARILWLANQQDFLVVDSKGTSINLDAVSEYVPQMYEYLRHEVGKTIIR
jgi:hypothetical protein